MHIEFDVPFEIGQKVWVIFRQEHGASYSWVPCTFCEERGTVTGADGVVAECPVCRRRGTVAARDDSIKWVIENYPDSDYDLLIEGFVIRHPGGDADKPLAVHAALKYSDGDDWEGYDENNDIIITDILPSSEEAQAEVDRRNRAEA